MVAYPKSVKALLNYAANAQDAGLFDINHPEHSQQRLQAVDVELRNARLVDPCPALAAEGFAFVEHRIGEPHWENAQWLTTSYADSCLELVKRLTGANAALQIFEPIVRHADPAAQATATAHFIHLDQTRDNYREFAASAARAQGLELGENAMVLNVWKAISPPPQDMPLAVCDRRTIDPRDYVLGMYVDGEIQSPYISLAHSAAVPTWYFVPDLTADESLVFISADLNPNHALGCAHTAFSPPQSDFDYVPRASVEVRVLALFG